MFAPVYNCGAYGCTNPMSAAQCPFCTFFFCPWHAPGRCVRCGYVTCAACCSRGQCCAWASTSQRAYTYGPPISQSSYSAPSSYVPPPTPVTTDDIETAITARDEWPTFLDYVEGNTFDYWSTPPSKTNPIGFPGLNIKFLIQVKGEVLEAHVKWDQRSWCKDNPYAMSLKRSPTSSVTAFCRESLRNINSGTDRYLWQHLLHRARKLIAADRVRLLLLEFHPVGVKVTQSMVDTLVLARRDDDLAALYLADTVPLSDWAPAAWSALLDWLTG